MLERTIVGKDILDHHLLRFHVEGPVKYKQSGEPDAFAVCLSTATESICWLQGWDDLDFNYLREYAGRLGVVL